MRLTLSRARSQTFDVSGWRRPTWGLVLAVACLGTTTNFGLTGTAEDGKKTAVQITDDDALRLVIDQYEKACDTVRSSKTTEEGRLHFYSDWRERIAEAIRVNPNSRYVRAGTVKLLGIANSLGDSQTAEELTEQLASQSEDPRERFRWDSEMGEIANARYQVTKNLADAGRAIESFAKAAEVYRTLEGKAEPGDRNRNIINLCMMAVLDSCALRNHDKAARTFQEVRESLITVPPSNELATLRYDFEYAASNEMMEWLAAKDPNSAETALGLLVGREGMRWPASYYAHMFVSTLYPGGGVDFQTFVDKWLAQKPQDEWTPFLRFYLAKDYFVHREYAAARPIFTDIKIQFGDAFLKADQEAIRIGRGGFYSEILYCLAVIYRELGDQTQARAMAGEMKALVPNDPRMGDLEKATSASHSIGETKMEDARLLPQSSSRRIALVVTGAFLIVPIAVFIFRRLRSRSQ